MSKSANALTLVLAACLLGGMTGPSAAQQMAGRDVTKPSAKLGLGRAATAEEIAAWDTDVRPDGRGLPVGKGTVKQGDDLFQEKCASCHGEFGQGVGRWPVLAGGAGTLKADRPDKTVGSFWPDLSTVFDYIKRAMPYGNAQSLTNDEIYALTAYILSMNDIVKDEKFELNEKNFTSIKMPNAAAFFEDDRETSEKQFWNKNPCMKDCRPVPKVTGRAMSIDVTPDGKSGPKVE
ncbi:cytochrome c [Bradyrhizobium sp. NFR13]|uniref:c-type cytochrome n=1 Tax=Bradyrhizobium sp. NFR13 TaxID=1566285 RepID=UPI0008E74B86|nr:cytochrome c [Bradyrhizobium sp. NFR13]SFM26513.1 cytochrome c [Bradyrhizobium sp. NFR13]